MKRKKQKQATLEVLPDSVLATVIGGGGGVGSDNGDGGSSAFASASKK